MGDRGGAALDGRLAELIPGTTRTEMQRRVLEHDWGSTALGDEESWSPTLRSAVSTCLNSRFPTLLMWGEQLVMIYNDGYAPMLGARHPDALGSPATTVWADIWVHLQPMVDEVMAGRATYSEDLPLVMTRYGFVEETYFSFSFSPVVEPGGRVAGLLDTVVETTHRVLATRRLTVLQRLGSLTRSVHGSTLDAVTATLEVLAEARTDCPFGLVFLEERPGAVRLVAGHGTGVDRDTASSQFAGAVATAIDTGTEQVVGGLATAVPGLSRGGASPVGEADVDAAVVLPLTLVGAVRPTGAVVLGTSPHLQLDDDYLTFLSLAAGQISAALADAQAVEIERRRAAEQSELDRARAQFLTEVAVTLQRAVLGPTALPEGFAVHYEPATGTLEVGGDWYDVIDLPDGRYGVVVGDVVGTGLSSAAIMGQLRSAGRALLLESRSPAHVLSALDRFAALVPGASVSTVFCAVIDPVTGILRYSSAGHVPGIVVDADGGTRLLEAAGSLPLDVVADLDRPEAEVELTPGSTVLLYTDGLVERRDEAIDEGIARAVAALTAGRELPPKDLAEELRTELLDGAPDDDVAFLIYRCGG
ncbi:PP2C family protein-serine/threonine phosphatase [Blastococcus haudaquaticus]|uniref:Serine phosphatase RsbU, regulator of sigma subunit n=1 Tax=Blastococcus haudaquaticus TaxID=1938745 RepID=A0A286H8J7_9ACTN|nr:GAF domain-containing SpoIIE family protein phosphatase [Blastococcus haudaquaticus]SOE03786.1 Serine phosphatase RsbU, regulator of sigma subunit [Blastococcus haudaquaticus]